MFKDLIFIAALISIITAQVDYQQRIVYYNETDNACAFQPQADQIDIIIKIDGEEGTTTGRVFGQTDCNPFAKTHAREIVVGPSFIYYDDELNNEVNFKNEATKNYIFGELYNVVVKSTLGKTCILRSKKCSCQIFGDRTQQHYGVMFPKFPRASIYLKCSFVEEQTQ